jgi:hypothetical protein
MQGLILATVLSLASLSAHADEQLRKVTPFQGIVVKGPVSLVVEAGKSFSLRVEGDPTFIDRVTSEVAGGELRLGMKESKRTNIGNKDRVIVTLPALQTFSGEGAGQIILNNVRGERFDVDYRGAGRLAINGEVRTLRLHAEGVGEVDTKDLRTRSADVSFEGIGSVKVHASDKLDARVTGMGNLSYYGNPRVVNKSVSGIGSVVAVK